MANHRLDLLTDYPFQRLRGLLDGTPPAAGLAPIDMSIGEPQHPFPAFVGEVLHENRVLYGKYPPGRGTDEFRTAVTDWLNRRYDLPAGMVSAERHIVPLNGTREGLFQGALLAVPEEKAGGRPLVLIPNPFYQCYFGAAIAAGAEPRLVPTSAQDGFLPDFASLGEEVLARTALVYLCSPANPQGAVADANYFKTLITLARRHDFTLFVDECYAEIYDEIPPTGTLEACADLGADLGANLRADLGANSGGTNSGGGDMANVLVFHSLSKRSSLPGLRSGFAAGDADLVARFLKLRSYGGAPSPLPVFAAAAAAWRDEAHVEENRALYRAKLDIAEQALAGLAGFYRPAGGFFLWLDVGDGEEVAQRLWREGAVRVLPGGYLAQPAEDGGNPGQSYIRVALVHDPATTADALERMRTLL